MNHSDKSVYSSDLLLWQQVKNGNEVSLGKLLKRYFNALQNYGCKFIRNEDFVKDCVQEVFIEIWNRRDRINAPDSVRAYLLSSVRRRVLRESQRQRMATTDTFACLENDAAFVDFSPEWLVIQSESLAETTSRIGNTLNQLPRRQREVIYLRFYQNLERDEIAEIMGINPQSISNLLQVAFKSFCEHWTTVLIWVELLAKDWW